jgi:hypothetical protein
MAKHCYPGDTVRVRGWPGVAFTFLRFNKTVIADEDGDEVTTTEDLDRAVVVMVGDDKRHTVDIDDLSPLPRAAYCGECGQIGCCHDGRQ